MRKAFTTTLAELADDDQRIALLTGDLGYLVLEGFSERHPSRFFNVGVAEQNMVGIATGLAAAGMVPFVYSIATFATMRPYEFIRNGPTLHRLPVRIVGVGGGFDYGHNGMTHFALEDLGAMRLQPEMTVISPADPDQVRTALRATAEVPGPIYFRVSKSERALPELAGRFRLGRAERIRDGDDVALLAHGSISPTALEAAELLAERGIDASVTIVACLSPAPLDDLAQALERVPLAVACETHYRAGALGSLLCELVAERGLGCRVARASVAEMPRGQSGGVGYLERRHGLTADAIAALAVARMGEPAA